MDLFRAQNAAGTTIVLITHDLEVAEQAKRIIRVRDGSIESDVQVNQLAKAADEL